MNSIGEFLRQFLAEEGGISSVEYALLLAFVAGGIISAAEALSTAVIDQLESTADCVDGTTNPANC